MQIMILHISNTYNYGSMMMGENLIYYLNKLNNKIEFTVESNDINTLKRLRSATGIENIKLNIQGSFLRPIRNKIEYFFPRIRLTNELEKYDKIIVLGGDDLTEDYGWKSLIVSLLQYNAFAKKGKKVFFVGQTMGPFSSFWKPIVKYLLINISKIYPRDTITFEYLQNLGLKKIKIMDDLALLPLAKQINKNSNENRYILFCPSELINNYAEENSRERYVEYNLNLIQYLLDKYKDKKIVLLAHVLKPVVSDDRLMVKSIYEKIKSKEKERIIVKTEEMLPYQVREILNDTYLTVSARMHPIISSFQCNVPGVAISYSRKYHAIIGERFGLKDYIVDIRENSYEDLYHKTVHAIEKIENNYKSIVSGISAVVKDAEKSIMDVIKELATK